MSSRRRSRWTTSRRSGTSCSRLANSRIRSFRSCPTSTRATKASTRRWCCCGMSSRRRGRVASKAKQTWDKFRKERDFHRMHPRRVVQEKNKLIIDLKRLKRHYEQYEPTLTELRHKYEVA